MTVCSICGQVVPEHLKHLPSRQTGGVEFGGDNPCRLVAIDRNGRTSREAAAWARLERAARHRGIRNPEQTHEGPPTPQKE
jgi:hypothetical protein